MLVPLLGVSKKLFYNKKICPENLRNRKKQPIFALAFQIEYDSVAQLVEHIPFKDGVLGSSPSWITEEKRQAPDKQRQSSLIQ